MFDLAVPALELRALPALELRAVRALWLRLLWSRAGAMTVSTDLQAPVFPKYTLRFFWLLGTPVLYSVTG